MRPCASSLKPVLAAGLAVLLSACAAPESSHGISIEQVSIEAGAERLEIRMVQRLELSREAQDALRHGVPLNIRAQFEVRAVDTRGPVALARRDYEIRYLPLSQHYQLTAGEQVRTYPRLRHVVAALERINTEVQTTALAAGPYTLRARVFLDRASLPAPMQLPAVLSAQWRHDSLWSTWPFAISV